MKLSRLSTVAATAAATMLAAAARASAATGEQTPLNLEQGEPTRGAAPGTGGGVLRTFVGLAVVLAVIYGVYWILKQVRSSREERASGSGLAPLATLPLGPGRSLHMVRAGSEVVLIGVGEHGVTPIRSYAEAEARAAGLLDEIADGADDGWHGEGSNGALVTAPAAGSPAPPSLGALVDALRRRTVRR